jgi:hypothetical protein
VPVSRPSSCTSQGACTGHDRRFPVNHLGQQATPQNTGTPCLPRKLQLGRHSPLCGPHLRSRTPADTRQRHPNPQNNYNVTGISELSRQVAALSTKKDRPRKSFRDLSPTQETYIITPEIPVLALARAADPAPETTENPPSAGTTAASGTERRSARRPATTTSRETEAADISGGICLLHNDGSPLRY